LEWPFKASLPGGRDVGLPRFLDTVKRGNLRSWAKALGKNNAARELFD
jgi:hypothetical protein